MKTAFLPFCSPLGLRAALTVLAAASTAAAQVPGPLEPGVISVPMLVRQTPAPAERIRPLSPAEHLLPADAPIDLWFVIPSPDVDELLAEDARTSFGPTRIGVPVDLGVVLDEHGTGWSEVRGGRLWVARVSAAGAEGLRLELTDLDLPRGAELWVRADDAESTRQGPFRGAGPDGSGSLWTRDFFSDTVTVEYFVPAGADRDGTFRIPRAQYLYRGFAFVGGAQEGGGSCHENVMCYPDWHPLHNATVRITFVNGGTSLCSSTLLATQTLDETPYIVTAQHCVDSGSVAATVTAYFFYQTNCGGGNVTFQAPSHCSFMATSGSTDMTLLVLDEPLPAGVTWAGWTTAGFPTGTPLVGIHHPGGDRKKISFGDRITYPFGGGGATFYWGVDWDLGTIEGGSSGSGLYTEAGQDFVGVASHSSVPLGCSNPDGPSGYGKLQWFHANVTNASTLLNAGPDDSREPNDSCAAAYVMSPGSLTGLIVKSTSEDWYSIDVGSCQRLQIDMTHNNAWGDVDLQVFDGCGGPQVATNLGSSDNKQVIVDNTTDQTKTYVVRAFLGAGDSDTRAGYHFTSISVTAITGCVADPFADFCNAADNSTLFCPCGNMGDPDAGCDNAGATGGVRADVTAFDPGIPLATITCTGYPPASAPTAILIRSTGLIAGAPSTFGDGVRCVDAPIVRLAAATAAGGTSLHTFGHGAGPGTYHYQAWYRSTPATFCTPDAFNLSRGRTIVWP